MSNLHNPSNRSLHLVVAHKLSHLVSSLATDSSPCEISGSSGITDDALGVVTQVLPITRFDSIDDIEHLANVIEITHVRGPSNVWSEMSGIFHELALNAVQHSMSAAGCYVVLAYATVAPTGIVYVVGVADGGIGIPASLRQNPDLTHTLSDAESIAYATELHVTGTGEPQRGLGLDHVMQVVKGNGGNFVLISAMGYVNIVNGLTVNKENVSSTDSLPGTVTVVTLSV